MMLHDKLKRYRMGLGLSQAYIASLLDIPSAAILAIEEGTSIPSDKQLDMLATIYGVSIEQMFHNQPTSCFKLSEHDERQLMNLIEFQRRI